MEFRRGTPERRQDRRICPSCQLSSGTKHQCPRCSGKTEARIQIAWHIGGKRFRELTYCWRDRDAADILRRKEADYWRQQELGVEREVGGPLHEAIAAYTKAQIAQCSANYRKQVHNALGVLVDGLGKDRQVHLITAQDISQYKDDRHKHMSQSSVRSYMLVVRRLFAYLHQEGWIRRNPTVQVKLPRAQSRKDHLRPTEVGPVLDVFWRKWPDIAPIATALALGGWRKGEIINLRRSDVDLASRWAYVLDFEGDELTEAWSPKTESSRRAVPLHPLVVTALERVEPVRCPDGRLSPWMFPVADPRKRRRCGKPDRRKFVIGDRRSPNTTFFGLKLHEALKEAGVPRKVTIHGLRRTFAVLLQETGAPDSVIRQALGHGGRGVTELHYLPRRDQEVMKWVDQISIRVSSLAPAPTKTDSQPIQPIPPPPPVASHCHQAATNPVANRPPYLRLVK